MPFSIEIVTTQKELIQVIKSAYEPLNKIQNEFKYSIAPERLLAKARLYDQDHYHRDHVINWMNGYKVEAGGTRPFIILIVDKRLSGSKDPNSNLYGIHDAKNGFACFTTYSFDPSLRQFLFDMVRFCRYYIVRYSLSFVNPEIKSHIDTRGCLFDFKNYKPDILKSLSTGKICSECHGQLMTKYNEEIQEAIPKLLQVVSNSYPLALVMKGGGVKGLAFAGALIELGKHFTFDTFAGTSAGAITATLLGAGYSPDELVKIMRETDFTAFKDAHILKAMANLAFKGGMYPGVKFRKWMNDLIKSKLPQQGQEIQMQNLKSRTILYASSRGHGILRFDSNGHRKEALASFATRCSMSIPGFFIPVKADEYKVYDGGLGNNFPLKIFKEDNPEKLFLALYLQSSVDPDSSVIKDLEDIITDSNEREVVDAHRESIVLINPEPIKTTQFKLTDEEKNFLVLCGRVGALKYLRDFHKDLPINHEQLNTLEDDLESKRDDFMHRRR